MDIKTVLISGVILFLIDSLFIFIISKFYGNMIENIQKSPMKVRTIPAIICYFLLIFALNYFILKNNSNHFDALFLGWVIYGVYDSTAYAIIDKWDLKMALVDSCWGGILFFLATICTRFTKKAIENFSTN